MQNNKNNITLSFKNIISFLNNLTVHFTEKEKIITLCLIILMLSFINIIFNITNISALSYESEVGIGFTFNPTLSISLSSSDLIIPNLTPGSSENSNNIDVSVATNASYGYTLSVNTSSDYLTHSNNINTFNSITIDADLANLTTDNTWGYSTSLDNGTSWSNYNGLSSSNSTALLDKDNNTSSNVDFKIAAKAGNTQPSGTYTNTITFVAVTKPTPMSLAESYFAAGKTRHNGYYTMQDMTTDICTNTEVIGESSQTQLIDIRDDKVYWATKLADGHCWMTENLDLAGGTKLYSETSDVPTGYSITKNTPYFTLPASSISGFYNDSTAFVYNSNNKTCDGSPCYSYYSWPAATLGGKDKDGNIVSSVDIDTAYSICPKNWKLPNSRTTTTGNSDFYQLAVAYGMNKNVVSQSTSIFYNNAGPNTIPNFPLTGNYYHNSFEGINNGKYWSSTAYGGQYAQYLTFNSSQINSSAATPRRHGFSIRCLAR